MFRTTFVLLVLTISVYSAEISSSYALLEKNAAFRPDLKTEPLETHAIFKKDSQAEERHPVYKNEGRAKIEPVRPKGPIIKHDMLADQPVGSTEVNRIDNLAIPNYAYVPAPAEVAYPDVPYAPGYGYEGYPSQGYDVYGSSNTPNSYLMEPDASPVSLLWSQFPDSRTLVSYAGRTMVWIFNSIIVVLFGSLITVGLCSYTNLCTITFHGVGPIHEEMRSLVSPERLEKISHAADFVKNAIDKYQKIQQVTGDGKRKRRAVYY
ncbi:uncharacterized protein LOC126370283 isoform X1 [Pectinophora gossypiella]|uniref:uncharacterized protein LOC126370283 isoform X1 n=1 Tax=Pectinophora gossypiella TaxID=13191 RepID=UPI00214EA241|nr:uncharacterized protein LOC126370283 isoform X1 [Pectinophora gossypiella]XP_049871071.1 uncharacterized protein LOC126370283 isoform X1 [Pectinophora gossypiella]